MSDASCPYDEEYFLRGKQTGKSLYEDYRWLPDMTVPMVNTMITYLGIRKEDTILDFGCARGYTVKALRMLGYNGFGFDVSEWALGNADLTVAQYLTSREDIAFPSGPPKYSWIVAKDVLEHISGISSAIWKLMYAASKGVFAVVPLATFDHAEYVVADYELDVTHRHRLTLATWVRYFLHPGWSVEASYRVPGIKDDWYKPERGWTKGNGFIVARRMIGE